MPSWSTGMDTDSQLVVLEGSSGEWVARLLDGDDVAGREQHS